MREIGPDNPGVRIPRFTAQGESHVAGAAAKIENPDIRTRDDVLEDASGTTPPEAVHVTGKHVVQKIVARRDGSEHVAHGPCCGLSIAGPCGRSAHYVGFDGFGQINSGQLLLLLPFRGFQLFDEAFNLQHMVRVMPGEHARQVRDAFFAALEVHSIVFPGLARDLVQHLQIAFA
jgi:hypothetical protein